MMTPTVKRGATLKILLELEPDEWDAIWPWNAIASEANQGGADIPLAVTAEPEARQIVLTADTSDWLLRMAKIDVRIEREGEVIYLPPDRDMQALIIAPVTED